MTHRFYGIATCTRKFTSPTKMAKLPPSQGQMTHKMTHRMIHPDMPPVITNLLPANTGTCPNNSFVHICSPSPTVTLLLQTVTDTAQGLQIHLLTFKMQWI